MPEKTIIITGANRGIGLATAKSLAKTQDKIIITARNLQKGQAAIEEIKQHSNNTNVHLQLMDLGNLTSIRKAAKNILAENERIDILVNNAGIILLDKTETSDGFESQFGVNHLGPFLFTNLLLDRIRQTAKKEKEARIVNVSSGAHRRTKGINFNDINWQNRKYNGIRAYADSKLANILMANEIARRYGSEGVFAHSLHPGAVKTNIFKNDTITGMKRAITQFAFSIIGLTPEKGALTSIHLATNKEAINDNGKYWIKCKQVRAVLPKNEEEVAQQLWTLSAQLTGLNNE